MDFEVLGWPEEGPTLDLDHRSFSYAGKFMMSSTGKAVIREDGKIVAALSFNEDRTDPDTMWFRYLTVRADRRGDGIGSRLAAAARNRISAAGYGVVRIAVNNPFSYEALYRAGFAYTGETTGIAELVLSTAAPRSTEQYHEGLDTFTERSELTSAERSFLEEKLRSTPPEPLSIPSDWRESSP